MQGSFDEKDIKKEINYEEIFSPMVRFASIHLTLAIITYLD
jgi:hypothetical protein